MKKLSRILFFVFLMVTCVTTVYAQDNLMTCEYYKPYDQFSGSQQIGILCEIYTDYSHQCYVEVGSAKATTSSNKEKIQNWGAAIGLSWQAKEYVKNNNKCPDYLLVKIDSGIINGYEIHAAENMQDLLELKNKLTGQRYSATSTSMTISSEKLNEAKEEIKSYITAINNFVNSYSLESCINNDKTITRISECKQEISSFKSNIYTFDVNVLNYVNAGYFSEEDALIQEYREAVLNANAFLENAEQELDQENEKIKEDLGLTEDKQNKEEEAQKNSGFIFKKLDCSGIFSGDFGQILKQTYNLIKFAVPIMIIAFAIVDFIKSMAAHDQNEIQKSANKLVKRLIIGVLIFVLPTLLEFILGIAGIQYGVCNIG